MGWFLTADWSATPVAIPYADLGNPQSLNLYSYVENNPITGVDPEGHFRFPSGNDQDPQYESPDSATASEQAQEAQKERAAEKATTMPFPLTPELPRLGKLVTAALGAAADLVTTPIAMVVATVGYLVSPGTGGMTEEKDTIQGHTPPFASQQGTVDTGPINSAKAGSTDGPGSGKRATPGQREQALRENGGKCVFCGKRATQADHATPRSRGGDTTPRNLQPTCRGCNQEKGAKTTQEYLEWLKNH